MYNLPVTKLNKPIPVRNVPRLYAGITVLFTGIEDNLYLTMKQMSDLLQLSPKVIRHHIHTIVKRFIAQQKRLVDAEKLKNDEADYLKRIAGTPGGICASPPSARTRAEGIIIPPPGMDIFVSGDTGITATPGDDFAPEEERIAEGYTENPPNSIHPSDVKVSVSNQLRHPDYRDGGSGHNLPTPSEALDMSIPEYLNVFMIPVPPSEDDKNGSSGGTQYVKFYHHELVILIANLMNESDRKADILQWMHAIIAEYVRTGVAVDDFAVANDEKVINVLDDVTHIAKNHPQRAAMLVARYELMKVIKMCKGVRGEDGFLKQGIVSYCLKCMYNTIHVSVHGRTAMELVASRIDPTKITLGQQTYNGPIAPYTSEQTNGMGYLRTEELAAAKYNMGWALAKIVDHMMVDGVMSWQQMLCSFTGYCSGDRLTFTGRNWSHYPPTAISTILKGKYRGVLRKHIAKALETYSELFPNRHNLNKAEWDTLTEAEKVLVTACIDQEVLYDPILPTVVPASDSLEVVDLATRKSVTFVVTNFINRIGCFDIADEDYSAVFKAMFLGFQLLQHGKMAEYYNLVEILGKLLNMDEIQTSRLLKSSTEIISHMCELKIPRDLEIEVICYGPTVTVVHANHVAEEYKKYVDNLIKLSDVLNINS